MRRKWRTIKEGQPEPGSYVLVCMNDGCIDTPDDSCDYELVKYLTPEGAHPAWEDKTGDRWHCKDDDYWICPPVAPVKGRRVKKTDKYLMLSAILSSQPEILNGLDELFKTTALLYYVEKMNPENLASRLNETLPKEDENDEYTVKDVLSYLGRMDRMLYIELLKKMYDPYKDKK